jgi:1,4-alpha-glucan branching enzyme
MFTHPGTKLLFMGGEFGQTSEWNHDRSLDWYLLDHAPHQGILTLMRELNALYKSEPALYQFSFDNRGFEWVDYSDRENSVMIFMRKGERKEDSLIVACNFTPELREMYRVGVPYRGSWSEILNSDKQVYGGSGVANQGLLYTSPVKYHQKDYSITLTLPPLAVVVLKLKEAKAEFELEE